MAATRTQIYLTQEQRERLDEMTRHQGKSLAEVVRQAVDEYLDRSVLDLQSALDASFGSMPDLEVPPRDEWDRGYG
ncbi:MAG: ribbon-helix-helix domain-containing protein [Actinomycetota bacterium]|nr:ribbon-helix-helix domain-containing protein [Actinomycetota bacterium]MDQ3720762.1 ribbon-helix-helix domain-containing protein [Actinomycetota bacterium]